MASADLNDDGKLDLVVSNSNSDTASVLLNTTTAGATTPTFTAKYDFTTGDTPNSLTAADLNGDLKPDLAVTNSNSDSVSVLLNTTPTGAATPSFASKVDFATGSHSYPLSVAANDLNDDGKPDLAVAKEYSGNVSVLLNTTAPGAATPSFTAKTDFAAGIDPCSVAAVDLNDDDLPDLAVANINGDTVSVLLNTTAPGAITPSFAAKIAFPTGDGPNSVVAADLNGDQKLDLALTNFLGDTSSVLLNGAWLYITKMVSPSVAEPGQGIAYTLTFTNPNIITANAVIMTDTLPVSLTGIVVTSNVAITNTETIPAYVWQVQDLAPGAVGIITLTGKLASFQPLGVFTNTATIKASNTSCLSAAASVTVR